LSGREIVARGEEVCPSADYRGARLVQGRAGNWDREWLARLKSIARRSAEFSRAIAIDERAACATLEIVPPLDRVDAAEDRLPVPERTMAAGTPQLWWRRHRRRGDRRPPSGPFRRFVGRLSVRCGGLQRIGRGLLLGLLTAMACSHVGLKRVSAASPFLAGRGSSLSSPTRARGSLDGGGHALAAWRPRKTGGSVKKSASAVCRVSNRRKRRRTYSLCYCVHTLSSLPSASPGIGHSLVRDSLASHRQMTGKVVHA
jgi:hypothetical protein